MEQNTTNDQAIENFKKNAARWRLAAVILGIASVVLVVYANVQKAIAEENIFVAMQARTEAEARQRGQEATGISSRSRWACEGSPNTSRKGFSESFKEIISELGYF